MNDWPLRKLSDVVEFQNRKRIPLKSADRALRQGAYPYYGASGIVDWIDDYLFEGRHLLISEDGENLRSRTTPIAFRVDGRFWVNNHAHVVTEREPGILDYLEYAMARFDLAPYITGAAQPKLNKGTLEAIQLRVPPVDERLAINSILNSLTDKIELNRRMSATLEEMARALFRSWFVDFDPVHAKVRGEAPAHMDAATAALFPDSFGDDGLPEGWSLQFLSALCGQRRATIDPGRHGGEIFEHFSLPAYDAGAYPVREAGEEIRSQKLIVPPGTILFSRLNPSIPRVWWSRPSSDVFSSVASTEFLVAAPHNPDELPYLYAVLSSEDFRTDVLARVTGTSNSHQRVKPGSIMEIEVPMGSDVLRHAYSHMTRPWFDRAAQAVVESQTLAALRDALLPKLMSGELRVRDAEQQIAEAV